VSIAAAIDANAQSRCTPRAVHWLIRVCVGVRCAPTSLSFYLG